MLSVNTTEKVFGQLTRKFRSRGESLPVVLLPVSQLFYPFRIEVGGDTQDDLICPLGLNSPYGETPTGGAIIRRLPL